MHEARPHLQAMDSVAVNGSAKPRSAADVPAERPSAPADAEEDIFGDAGRDFVPELPKRASDDNGAHARITRVGSYYPDTGMHERLPLHVMQPLGHAAPHMSSFSRDKATSADMDVDALPPPPPPPPPLPAADAAVGPARPSAATGYEAYPEPPPPPPPPQLPAGAKVGIQHVHYCCLITRRRHYPRT